MATLERLEFELRAAEQALSDLLKEPVRSREDSSHLWFRWDGIPPENNPIFAFELSIARDRVTLLREQLNDAYSNRDQVGALQGQRGTRGDKTETKPLTVPQERWQRFLTQADARRKEDSMLTHEQLATDETLLLIWPKTKRPKTSTIIRKLQGRVSTKPGRR